MELRDLQAFVAVAEELRFARAAERLYLSPSSLSELVRRLEAELGTSLFVRTTRHVELTAAGVELLDRAKAILADVAGAERAVAQVADRESGVVRLGVTPPVGPVLLPHLSARFALEAPAATVESQRMWLPDLDSALVEGGIDVAITCGHPDTSDDVTTVELCADQLLVGLRAEHRLADQEAVSLVELAHDRLGMHSPHLFPAWSISQQDALRVANIAPPMVELTDTDLVAGRWMEQPNVDWILLISSLCGGHTNTVIKPTTPLQHVPFALSWVPDRARAPVVERFVQCCLEAEPPPGWVSAGSRSA